MILNMSKSKLLIIALSLATTAASIFIYFNQKFSVGDRELKDSLIKSRLSGFQLYRYRSNQLVARTTGDMATLYTQGRLSCSGRIRMVRIEDGQRQEIQSDEVDVNFQNENLFGDGAGLVDTILFSGNVDYTRGNSRFQTDWIKYSDKTGEAVTDRPVRIDSENQFIAAEGGMIYNTKSGALRMRGGVFGSVRQDLLNKSGTKGKGRK
jgi:hypothetical protein